MRNKYVVYEVNELFNIREYWGWSKIIVPTTWGADWDYFSTANHVIIP